MRLTLVSEVKLSQKWAWTCIFTICFQHIAEEVEWLQRNGDSHQVPKLIWVRKVLLNYPPNGKVIVSHAV